MKKKKKDSCGFKVTMRREDQSDYLAGAPRGGGFESKSSVVSNILTTPLLSQPFALDSVCKEV